MRGEDEKQEAMFSYVSPERRVPMDHPPRPVREMVDGVLKEMSPRFARLYSNLGRPSIALERLLRALLLQVFYSVRSERMLMEQLDYNLLFRWFVGMEMDEEVWDHAVFSKNRDRLLNQEIAEVFFARVLKLAKPYLSDEHFTVDGTLIEAWASQKSFRPKDEAGSGSTPREDDGDAGRWSGGARRGVADGLEDSRNPTRHAGRGQELRLARLCRYPARDEDHAACGAEQHLPVERD
jgi:transposase